MLQKILQVEAISLCSRRPDLCPNRLRPTFARPRKPAKEAQIRAFAKALTAHGRRPRHHRTRPRRRRFTIAANSLLILREHGVPVVFDATHSVQRPGGRGGSVRRRSPLRRRARAGHSGGGRRAVRRGPPRDPPRARSEVRTRSCRWTGSRRCSRAGSRYTARFTPAPTRAPGESPARRRGAGRQRGMRPALATTRRRSYVITMEAFATRSSAEVDRGERRSTM